MRRDLFSIIDMFAGEIASRMSGLMVLWDNGEPRWLKRIKEGHVLPWMQRKTKDQTATHAPVLMHRSIVSLRVQTHTVK